MLQFCYSQINTLLSTFLSLILMDKPKKYPTMKKTKLGAEHKYGLGGVPIGNCFEVVTDKQAEETLEAAWEAGVRYYDTSPFYGFGLSERRFGHFLHNKKREEYLLSSKVGRILYPTKDVPESMWNEPSPFAYRYDYTAEGVRRSIEDSLQRLGVERLDYVFIHDLSPDNDEDLPGGWEKQFEIAKNGAMPELSKMRDEGLIQGWGLGVNTIEPILRTLEVADPDIFLCAIQYSIVEHKEAKEKLLPAIENSDADLIIAAPFNAGLLAGKGRYNYWGKMPDDIKERYETARRIAKKHNVDLVDASLQFSYAPEAVSTVLAGASKPDQVKQNIAAFDVEIPEAFWQDLTKEGILEEQDSVPA